MITQLPTALDLAAIAIGGIFGAAVAAQKKTSLVGVMLIGVVMALGGGILRDIFMQVEIVAMHDVWYIPVAVAGSIFGLPVARKLVNNSLLGPILDGTALGLWVVIGTEKALIYGFPFGPSVLIGLITAIGGGTIVDLMVGNQPVVLRADGPWFATAAFVGATFLASLYPYVNREILELLTISLVAALRIASIRLGFDAPSTETLKKVKRKKS
ncbi:MAG: hypothetical protein RLZZ508_373 [Actinomycetota bacterium]|jgi:uncharacterized membrane protein YeiH